MRPIKFRAWDKVERKMLYFDLYNINCYIQEFNEALLDGLEFNLFTGLKDRNGKEIWEGDLIKNNTSRICEVTWCKREGAWDAEVVKATGYADGFLPEKWKYCIEVIGNIYEHSDLLK
jgi:uncharacterized phage protein (TIGR01671 family)